MMKKVTIITPPEYEGLILESLGRAQVTQFKHVTGPEFEGLETPSEKTVDYRKLYQRVQTHLLEPLNLDINKVTRVTPPTEELVKFSRDPEEKVDSLIKESENLISKIESIKEGVHVENNKLISELQAKLATEEEEYNDAKAKLLEQLKEADAEKLEKYQELLKMRTRLDSVSALEPDELKNCFAVGVVDTDFIPQMNEYLKRHPDTYSKASKLSNKESLLFVFGNEESKSWIEALFLVYDIKDIFDVLDPADVLLVLDESKRQEAIKKYKEKLAELEKDTVAPEDETPEEKELREKVEAIEAEHEKSVNELKAEYDAKIEENNKTTAEQVEALQNEQQESFGTIAYYGRLLWIYSRRNTYVLRGNVISVLQGYTPDSKVPDLRAAIKDVEAQIEENLYVEVSELGHDDKHAPTPELDIKPKALQPLWILTRLRGWPSAEEINPGYISIIIFCIQFGLMFGDIGQGLVFLLIGLALRNRFDRGMMKYLTTLFVPLGISAIIFGFMYDSTFLIEHALSDWIHEAGFDLPFHYPIMPNPIEDIGELMNLIFLVGALEVIFGALLGAANAAKEKNYVGMLGEHGFGMGLYVTGLYLSASHMFTEGINVVAMVGNWPFKLMLAGMGLSFIEPVLHSLQHGHGVGMESIGEGIGGLLMTFVEGLANMFSFLRIAAFALAHVSLAVASEQMGHAIGSPILALVIMNVIALSFEFVSSSVQSLRLLYYEFMGKFFQGGGIPFRPFRVN